MCPPHPWDCGALVEADRVDWGIRTAAETLSTISGVSQPSRWVTRPCHWTSSACITYQEARTNGQRPLTRSCKRVPQTIRTVSGVILRCPWAGIEVRPILTEMWRKCCSLQGFSRLSSAILLDDT